MSQRPTFHDELAKLDPEFAKLVNEVREKVRAPGALDAKTKTLITLAIDAAGSHTQGVINLARAARRLGATEEELKELVRLLYYATGNPGLVAGLAAFDPAAYPEK